MSNGQKVWEAIEKATPIIMFLTFAVAILYQIFGQFKVLNNGDQRKQWKSKKTIQ